jgi:hypothetical protein
MADDRFDFDRAGNLHLPRCAGVLGLHLARGRLQGIGHGDPDVRNRLVAPRQTMLKTTKDRFISSSSSELEFHTPMKLIDERNAGLRKSWRQDRKILQGASGY